MRKRIMDAWRVLKGEYIASPRVQSPTVWVWTGNVTTSTGSLGVPAYNAWIEPRAGSVER